MALAVIAFIDFMMNLDDKLRKDCLLTKTSISDMQICYFWGENYAFQILLPHKINS